MYIFKQLLIPYSTKKDVGMTNLLVKIAVIVGIIVVEISSQKCAVYKVYKNLILSIPKSIYIPKKEWIH